jgi:hypothetical protein
MMAGPGGSAGQPGGALPVVRVAAPVDASLALIERVFAMLAPILTAAMRPPAAPGAEMVQSYQALNQILRNQTMENVALLNDMTRKNTGLAEYGEEEEEEGPPAPAKPSMLETLTPFIAQIAEKILGGGPQGAAAAAMVKTVPGFKKVMNNPQDVKQIISYLDKTYGPEKTSLMLKKLRIERPK